MGFAHDELCSAAFVLELGSFLRGHFSLDHITALVTENFINMTWIDYLADCEAQSVHSNVTDQLMSLQDNISNLQRMDADTCYNAYLTFSYVSEERGKIYLW